MVTFVGIIGGLLATEGSGWIECRLETASTTVPPQGEVTWEEVQGQLKEGMSPMDLAISETSLDFSITWSRKSWLLSNQIWISFFFKQLRILANAKITRCGLASPFLLPLLWGWGSPLTPAETMHHLPVLSLLPFSPPSTTLMLLQYGLSHLTLQLSSPFDSWRGKQAPTSSAPPSKPSTIWSWFLFF